MNLVMGAGNLTVREGGKYQTQTKPSSTASMLEKPLTANLRAQGQLLLGCPGGNQMNLLIRSLGSNAWENLGRSVGLLV